MSSKQRDTFIPLPGGEVTAYTPDGTMRTDGKRVLSNLMDGAYAHGGPHACAGGGEFGFVDYTGGGGDVTTASPRRPPDYGGIIIKG